MFVTQLGLVQVGLERGRAEDDPGEDRGFVAHVLCSNSVTGKGAADVGQYCPVL